MPKTKEELEQEAKELEEKAAAELDERIGKAIDARMNKAISSHLKRELGKRDEKLDAILAKLGGGGGEGEGAGEADGDAGEAAGGEGGEPKGKKKAGEAQLPPEVEKRLRAMERASQAAEKRAKEAEAKAAEMEQRRRLDEENDLSTKALLGLGIKDDVQLESALLFHRGKGRIRRDDDGRPVFARKDRDGDEELVPLDVGIKEWGKTEEAKRFLPPTEAAGSGNYGGTGRAAGSGKKSGGYSDQDFFNDILSGVTGVPRQ